MKKLLLVLALLIITTSGAFAKTYPHCFNGGNTNNGTNKDRWSIDRGWCVDDYGVLTPQVDMRTSTTYPNSKGGMAVPVYNTNAGPTQVGGLYTALATYDSLIPQQTGSIIVDYGGFSITATVDSLVGSGGHHVLPQAFPGEIYTITSASKSVITVDVMTPAFALSSGYATLESVTVSSTDSIEWLGMTTGQNLKSPGNAGDSITLVSPSAGIWVVTNMIGQVGNIATADSLWSIISST